MAAGALAEKATETVASNLEEVAEVTRTINTQVVGAFLGGTGFGGLLGAIWGYRFGKRRTRAEAMKEAQKEIDETRETLNELHRQKTAAIQNEVEKRAVVDEVLEREGYVHERPLRPPVPVQPATPIPNRIETGVAHEPAGTSTVPGWNYNDEFAKRRAGEPYVIHEDEFLNENLPLHSSVSYTYYGVDAVLADEDGSKIENVEETIGKEALNRFGHGSSDPNTVYVRNDRLQLQIEINRFVGRSYEEDVEGLQNDKE
jgi:hypothetical protein